MERILVLLFDKDYGSYSEKVRFYSSYLDDHKFGKIFFSAQKTDQKYYQPYYALPAKKGGPLGPLNCHQQALSTSDDSLSKT